jgi:hypothetical protein
MISNNPTPAMIERAHELVTQAHTWQRARIKADGSNGYMIPSSDDPEHTGHFANIFWCSCKGHKQRGICSHVVAMRLLQQRSDAAISAKIKAADQERKDRLAAIFDRLYGGDE